MKVVKTDGDTIRFAAITAGEACYLDKTLLIRVVGPGPAGFTAVEVETGALRTVSYDTQVVPAKAHVVVAETGRVACGYNPR